MKKLIALLLAAMMVVGLAACAKPAQQPDAPAENQTDTTPYAQTPEESTDAPAEEAQPVTIRVFSNLTDRTSGQGLIEQMLFDNYMAENPNVTIEVEALDDESYKTKFKAYASGNSMPDLVNIWCSPSFLDEVVAANVLAPLNAADYADYGFADGSLAGVTYDGQLYGLPRNTDVLGFYYNKDMFAQYGLSVPTTWDELVSVCQTLNDNGVSGIAMDGQDGWVLAHFINCMTGTILGADTYNVMLDSVKNGDYSNPAWETSVSAAAENASVLFQTGFETTD